MRRTAASFVLTAVLASAACGSDERPKVRIERLDCADGSAFPYGTPALGPGWRRRRVVAGPLTFPYARDLAHQAFRPARVILRDELRRTRDPRLGRRLERTLGRMPPAGLGIAELLVLVEPGSSVTAVVPARAHGWFALVFSRRARNAERPDAHGIIALRDGDRAVRFPSCDAERWHYVGGVVASRSGCAPIDVHVRGSRPLRRYLPLGTGERRCRP